MNPRLISLKHRDHRAWVYPEQGFQLHGFERDLGKQGTASVIYTPGTLMEPPDRRYGNPVLFPSPSASHSRNGIDTWIWKEKTLAMPFHGIARNDYWHVVDIQPDRVTGELTPTTGAKLSFPFDFKLRLTYRLEDRGLVLDTSVENTGKEAFPYALGFHPYLRAPLGSRGSPADCSVALPEGVRLQSKNEWQSHEGACYAARRIRANDDLAGSTLLADTRCRRLTLEDQANKLAATVSLEDSEMDFPVWVIWSASPESPYVCLEPWTDAPNALNRPETRRCPPAQTHRYRMVIAVEPLK